MDVGDEPSGAWSIPFAAPEASNRSYAAAGEKKRTFLKRGEGVAKRVFAPRNRPPKPTTSGADVNDVNDQAAHTPGNLRCSGDGSTTQGEASFSQPAYDDQGELVCDTALFGVNLQQQQHDDVNNSDAHTRNMTAGAAPYGSHGWPPADEDLELAEFQALEQQLLKDVGMGASAAPRGMRTPAASASGITSRPGMRTRMGVHAPQPDTAAWAIHSTTAAAGRPFGDGAHADGWANPPDHGGVDDGRNGSAGGFAFHAAPQLGGTLVDAAPADSAHRPHVSSHAPHGAHALSTWAPAGDQTGPHPTHADGPSSSHGALPSASGQYCDDWGDGAAFDMTDDGLRRAMPAAARKPSLEPQRTQTQPRQAVANGSHAGTSAHDSSAPHQHQHPRRSHQQQQQQQLADMDANEPSPAPSSGGLTQPFVRSLFAKPPPRSQRAKPSSPEPSAAEIAKQKALDEALAKVASEKASLVRMRTEMEKAANRLEQERLAWERKQAEEAARMEECRAAERDKLSRERRVLEKQSRALLKLPNKKERSAVEAAEAALEAERREGRARDARHKLTVERLRRQIVELQEKVHEGREEVRWLESQLREGSHSPGGGAAHGTQPGHTPASTSAPAADVASTSAASAPGLAARMRARASEASAMRASGQGAANVQAASSVAQPQAHQAPRGGGGRAPGSNQQPNGGASKTGAPSVRAGVLGAPASVRARAHAPAPPHAPVGCADGEAGVAVVDAAAWQSYRQPLRELGGRGGGADEGCEVAGSGDDDSGGAASSANAAGGRGKGGAASLGHLPVGVARQHSWAEMLGLDNDDELCEDDDGYHPAFAGTEQAAAAAAPTSAHAAADARASADGRTEAPHGRDAATAAPAQGAPAWWSPGLTASSHMPPGVPPAHASRPTWEDQQAAAPEHAHAPHGPTDAQQGQSPLLHGQPHGLSHIHWAHSPANGASRTPAPASSGGAAQQPPLSSTKALAQHLALTHDTAVSSAGGHGGVGHADVVLRADCGAADRGLSRRSTTASAASVAPPPKASAALGGHAGAAMPAPQRGELLREVRHADGKHEQYFACGSKLVRFPNGARKATQPDGLATIQFANGDRKRQAPDGRVDYFYAEVGTWHTTHPDGVEVFYFPSGQTEAHHPGGAKEIIFPAGHVRRVLPNEEEQDVPLGLLSAAVREPKPVLIDE